MWTSVDVALAFKPNGTKPLNFGIFWDKDLNLKIEPFSVKEPDPETNFWKNPRTDFFPNDTKASS